VGFTDRFTLGVWVGNFDGRPMVEVSGATGAAPIFAAILRAVSVRHRPGRLALGADLSPAGSDPERWGLTRAEVCPLSGLLRSAACPKGVFDWLPQVAERSHCDWHRHAMIDVRNGLLAGPDCESSKVVEREVELLPPEYTQWAHGVGRPNISGGSSPHCPHPEGPNDAAHGDSAPTASAVQILSPADGSRFVLDPDRPRDLQRLQIAVAAGSSRGRPRLQINDGEPLELDASLRFDWRLEPGVHVFVATDERGKESTPVRISVRDAI
jgi:penicillin-binding protein 1C